MFPDGLTGVMRVAAGDNAVMVKLPNNKLMRRNAQEPHHGRNQFRHG